jgi:hypothetical protein
MDVYLEQVKAALEDSMGAAALQNLDFSKAVLSEMDSADLYVLNIPFSGIHTESFLLVQTDKQGKILNGRLICLKKEEQRAGEDQIFYNGSITIRSFKDEILVQSEIINGTITALHPKRRILDSRLSLLQPAQPAGEMLPEVIVIGYREPSGGVSYSDWISLQGMFGGGGSVEQAVTIVR